MKKEMKKRALTSLLALTMGITMLAGCGNTGKPDNAGSKSEENGQEAVKGGKASSGKTITVDFWTAPEQYNLDFWTKYADKFNESNIQLDGSKVEVKVQMMPAQPSSEAGIQNAIATGTVPAVSENINRGFANTLANSEAVYDLSGEDWFQDIVAERKLDEVTKGWAINNAQYVIPLYINPITLCYNSKALKELGFSEVPKTMADFNKLLTAYSEKKDELAGSGISHFMYRGEMLNSANYWERWFDIESPYDAFSKGVPLVDGNKLTADKAALTKVFEFYGAMGDSLLTGTIDGLWKQETVPVVMGLGLPWEVSSNHAAGKTYGLDGDYVFGPTLVENESDKHYNYADSKGIVLYKNNKISEDEHKGAIEFLKYVFAGDGKETFDLDWLEATTMLPVRGDLDTNESLASYFNENPAMKDISAYVADGIPGMANEKVAEIMTALGEKAVIPFVNEVTMKNGINQKPDVSKYVDAAMEAMKTAGELE
ncbi:ABC transporter substrate-binding protein [Lacrimispora saccharolytica]|uniref:Sugar ABC transporter n=1 Tax=Lacrimispora saccharolytica (strain ATCC 35040 / DSM 2544 / NRCC 2533 / WM1) TaxID=610130 RepID=D9R796_LACSW|nr:ABC transporter substrate-binding protein [Lacrimispora saccharolytica]ADL05528.1 sugar ABC transporter [[Clostridium] saccharolyticum WM1]QRV20311.1 carbohydrate ABC transporter substrate-binding protein [Lacrimispora saccharolytica]